MPLHPLAVDRFASALMEDIPPGDWAAMRDAVSDLVAAFRGAAARGGRAVHPGPDAREVVGDLITRMEAPALGSALQARLWTLSDRPRHRALGRAWLAAHPESALAPDGQIDDEHLRFVAEAPLTEDEAVAPPGTLRVAAAFDEASNLWRAGGPGGITAEAPSKPALLERLAEAAAAALDGQATLIVDWREDGLEHSTTLTVG